MTNLHLNEVAAYIKRVADREGPGNLAERLGISRSTLYGLMKGNWPSQKVCEILGITLLIPSEARSKKGKR